MERQCDFGPTPFYGTLESPPWCLRVRIEKCILDFLTKENLIGRTTHLAIWCIVSTHGADPERYEPPNLGRAWFGEVSVRAAHGSDTPE